MEQILVDNIVETPTLRYGFTATNYRIFEALQKLYKRSQMNKLLLYAIDRTETAGGIKFMATYRQLIVLAHIFFGSELQGQMYLIECKDDPEICLADFVFTVPLVWQENEKARFTEIFQVTRENRTEKAEIKLGIFGQ